MERRQRIPPTLYCKRQVLDQGEGGEMNEGRRVLKKVGFGSWCKGGVFEGPRQRPFISPDQSKESKLTSLPVGHRRSWGGEIVFRGQEA